MLCSRSKRKNSHNIRKPTRRLHCYDYINFSSLPISAFFGVAKRVKGCHVPPTLVHDFRSFIIPI